MTFGGVNIKQEPVDCVEIYDVEKKDWQGTEAIDTMRERVLGLSGVMHGKQQRMPTMSGVVSLVLLSRSRMFFARLTYDTDGVQFVALCHKCVLYCQMKKLS